MGRDRQGGVTKEATMEIVVLVIMAIFGVMLYLLPTLVALDRRHRQTGVVAVLNVFLGWTILGWIIALAIACSAGEPRPDPKPAVDPVAAKMSGRQ
jgi:hypothetical protein